MKVDAVIVGARPAGAATALLLARAGARVLLLDKGAYGTDALSTHALMRGAVVQLDRWGVLPAIVAAGTPPIHSTTFSYSEQEITLPIEPKFGVSALYAPRRALLDRVLVDAAVESGAEISYGVRVDDLLWDERGRVRGVNATSGGTRRQIEADMVIGADGLHSTIAERVGARRVIEGQHATATLYSYWSGLPTNGYYWWFRPGAALGAIPTNGGVAGVFVTVTPDRLREAARRHSTFAYRRLIREVAPDFDKLLGQGRRVEAVRGFGGHVGFMRSSVGPGWALVGDASYFKDPLTSHGITDALRDAELLARAVIEGTASGFARYDSTRRELSARLFEVTDEIASLTWSDERLQSLHRSLSAEMSREVRALLALEPLPWLTSTISQPHVA